jgi:putative hydrolase of HD superfamily
VNSESLVSLLLKAATLKRIPRTGWAMRGVPHVESVAEHSFGVAWVALALADSLQDPALDREKVLTMALLHDLAEVDLSDLPASAVQLISREVKSRVEAEVLQSLLVPLTGASDLLALWQEFEDGASREGRLVRDADKLEMMVQCLCYEQAGSRGLDEFWQATDRYVWHYSLCAEVYDRLKAVRPAA